MRLLNVRIAAEDERLLRSLREQGVSISDLVRRAIRAEASKRGGAAGARASDLLAEMVALFPTPAGVPAPRRVASTDRRAVRRLVRAKLRRPR